MDWHQEVNNIDFSMLDSILQRLTCYHGGIDDEGYFYIEGKFERFDVKLVSNLRNGCIELFIKAPEVIDHYAVVAKVLCEEHLLSEVLKQWYLRRRSEVIPVLKEQFFMEVDRVIRGT